jgi:hypothetical protein
MNSKTEQNKTKQNNREATHRPFTTPIRHLRMEIAGRQMPKDAVIVIVIESIEHAD